MDLGLTTATGLKIQLTSSSLYDPKKPIAFASHSLGPAEKYAQLEKEGLSSVKKFHQYLMGRHFTIYSDHKPISETRPVPASSSAGFSKDPTLGLDIYVCHFQ